MAKQTNINNVDVINLLYVWIYFSNLIDCFFLLDYSNKPSIANLIE